MYDIIGDVHGHYDALHRLLEAMGYVYDADAHVFAHASRQALFIGDYIDKGPENIKCATLIQNMVSAGRARAIMGNHDFNAVQYTMPDPDAPGKFLRWHTARNTAQHKQFLAEVEEGSAAHVRIIEWFKTLPIYLVIGRLHLVHACWDAEALAGLKASGAITDGGVLTDFGWVQSAKRGTEAFTHMEVLLKGPEEKLAEGMAFKDAHNQERKQGRVRWWNREPKTFADAYAFPFATPYDALPFIPGASNAHSVRLREGLKPESLIAFGHYWMSGPKPHLLSPNVVCVDWSVTREDGVLAAYRYDGETAFDEAKFFTVPSTKG